MIYVHFSHVTYHYMVGEIYQQKMIQFFFEKIFTLRLKRKVGISLHGAKVPDT